MIVDDMGMDVSGRDRGASKLRTILIVVIVILVLLLIGLGYFFTTLLVPAGTGEADTGGAAGFSWVRSIYGYGSGPNEQLRGPTSVAVGEDGTIYATDPQRSRILAFAADGAFRKAIVAGETGDADVPVRPDSLDMGPGGELYAVDSSLDRILVIDVDDSVLLREWPSPGAIGIDVVGDEVFVIGTDGAKAYSLEGDELYSVAPRGRSLGSELDAIYGITADSERVYVADTHNKAVKAFTRDGELLWVQTSVTTGDEGLSPEEALGGTEPPDIADDTTPTADATETAESTPAVEPVDAAVGLMEIPQDLTIDAGGRLVLVDAFAFKIVVLDPSTGDVLASYGEPGASDGLLAYPSGIEYDSGRDWYVVADTANDRVQVFRVSGSGGGAAQAASRLLVSPFRYCAIPLGLLLLALLFIALSSRRREGDNIGQLE